MNLVVSLLPQTVSYLLAATLVFSGLRAPAQAVVSTLAGTGTAGAQDGLAALAQFNGPYAVATDAAGNVYVADAFNHALRKITPAGQVSTIGGNGGPGYFNGPSGLLSSFTDPRGIVVDPRGNVYIADTGTGSIRRIAATDGSVSTLAGVGISGYRDGSAAQARFASPIGLALGADGSLLVGDASNFRIRRVDSLGNTTTLAGSGVRGYMDGPAATARFNDPQGVALDAAGNVFVADRGAHCIRKITPAGVVSTYAGTGTAGFLDGPAVAARFSGPTGVALDAAGNLFVMDRDNERIRRVDGVTGVVSTVAGTGQTGHVDGTASSAQFARATGLCLRGNLLYVADRLNHRIRLISSLPLTSPQPQAEPSALRIIACPNPAHERTSLLIQAQRATPAELTILTPAGQMVRRQTILIPAGRPLELPVAGLPAGLYQCRVSAAQLAAQCRLLITL